VPVLAYMLTALGAYLVGATPTGYLFARARGVDIRSVGSGNIGATNVFRILGKGPGICVLLIDALKGWLPVFILAPLAGQAFAIQDSHALDWLRITAGLGAVLGHNFTFWLRFKGGKGIATSAGVLVGLVPLPFLVVLAVFLVVLATTRYMSLASISGAAALPFGVWFISHNPNLTGVTAFMAAMAIYKHKSNIRRLLNGTESRFSAKKTPPTDSQATNTK
jgi:acyl phosphate:glycerol-3-phosphate acyltransferase